MATISVSKRSLPRFPNSSTAVAPAIRWALPVLILVLGQTSWAADDAKTATRAEFDPPPADSATATLDEVLPQVDFRLETSIGGFVFVDDGMSDAYSSIPGLRAGLTMDLGPQLQFLLSAGYGSATSDLEIDDTFDGTHELKLKMVPIQMGFRTNTTSLSNFRINIGASFQAVWLKETAPYFQTYPYLQTGTSTDTGWGHQVLMSMGPEWRLDNEKWVIGLEAVTGIGGGNVSGENHREISFDGFGGRLYCSVKLGSIKEEKRIGEVRP